jgi:trigger factor
MENLKRQKEKSSEETLNQKILEKFVDENKFDVPSAMVQQQERHVKEELERNLKSQGFNDDMVAEYFEKWQEDVNKKAEFQVRTGLILDKLSKTYNVETSDADLDKKIEDMAATSGMQVDQIKQYYTSNEQIKSNLLYAIREEKTFDALKS